MDNSIAQKQRERSAN